MSGSVRLCSKCHQNTWSERDCIFCGAQEVSDGRPRLLIGKACPTCKTTDTTSLIEDHETSVHSTVLTWCAAGHITYSQWQKYQCKPSLVRTLLNLQDQQENIGYLFR